MNYNNLTLNEAKEILSYFEDSDFGVFSLKGLIELKRIHEKAKVKNHNDFLKIINDKNIKTSTTNPLSLFDKERCFVNGLRVNFLRWTARYICKNENSEFLLELWKDLYKSVL